MEQPNFTPWSERTLRWICCDKDIIKSVANTLGVPAEAIAGIMAKENTAYLHDYAGNAALDGWLETVALWPGTTNQWWHDHAVAAEQLDMQGLLDKIKNKTINPAAIDAGPANMQVGTAILLLERYPERAVRLGLGTYLNDYDKLVRDLTGRPPHCEDAATRLTVALYGLMIKEALDFFNTYADPTKWPGSDSVRRDATLVSYCALGRRQIERNRDAAYSAGLPYQPQPGPGNTGGDNHIFNRCRVGRALLNISYGGESCALPWSRCFVASLDPETCEVVYRRLPCPPPPWPPHIAPPRLDPQILDLDGDRIETTHVAGQTYFDHDGDGLAERTGWVGSDDGLLVLDRNGNGMIDNGTELFGVDTILADGTNETDGFAALQELDTNGDGAITAADTQFGELRVWRDLNQDGICTTDELSTLAQNQIVSIGNALQQLAAGNLNL